MSLESIELFPKLALATALQEPPESRWLDQSGVRRTRGRHEVGRWTNGTGDYMFKS